ncbi:oligosaccharide flippase family protein [Aquipseudomonas alcaligenes]|uniref:oligosaccharide flippase family protein n=1 Tax=Aquipseudomonas alcaligenes TaxID=43263 RepID=UPI0035B177F9
MVSSTLRSAVGQFAGLVFGALAVKILAVTAGPSGVGLFSVLRHLQQSLSLLASIGGQAAIVQGLSSREGLERERFQTHVCFFFIVVGVLLSIGMLFFAPLISDWFFEGGCASSVRWLVISVLAGSGLFLVRGILNAHLRFGEVAWVNASAGLGGMLLAYPAGYLYLQGSYNALVAVVSAGPVAGLLVGWFFLRRQGLGMLGLFSWSLLRLSEICAFVSLAFPTLLSAIFTMGSILVVRALIVSQEGMDGGGVFDAAWSISALYLAFFLAALQGYLLPVFARYSPGRGLERLFLRALQFAFFVSFPVILVLVLLKPFLISVLFSEGFLPALEVLRWMLLGDCVKIIGWVMASVLMARADMRGFVVAEFLWALIFLVLSVWLLKWGLEWVGVAYFISYIGYAVFLSWRLCFSHGLIISLRVLLSWLVGFALISYASFIAWDSVVIRFNDLLLAVLIVLLLFLIMHEDERFYISRYFRVRTVPLLRNFFARFYR